MAWESHEHSILTGVRGALQIVSVLGVKTSAPPSAASFVRLMSARV